MGPMPMESHPPGGHRQRPAYPVGPATLGRVQPDAIRSLITRYTSAWAAADRDGWLSTFSVGATQEDPVGEGVRHGRDEIATFWDRAVASYDGIELRQRALHVI